MFLNFLIIFLFIFEQYTIHSFLILQNLIFLITFFYFLLHKFEPVVKRKHKFGEF